MQKVYLVKLLAFSILFLLIKSQQHQNSTVIPYPTPTYQFNLDLPYIKMMHQYYSDYKQQIQNGYKVGIQNLQQSFPQSLFSELGITREAFEKYSHIEYKQQIVDTAEFFGFDAFWLFASQISMGLIEPETNPEACTCAIIQNSQNQIFFEKNFDFSSGNYLGNVTVVGQFFKNGKLLYSAQIWPLAVGYITGMRQSSFAVSLNARFGGTIAENVQAFLTTGYTSHYLIQKVLETAETYDQAVQMLKTYPICYNVFYCIVGTQVNEGAVIARNINSVENFTTLNNTDPWFLVQTNYDRDLPDPQDDYRRIPAQNKIQALGYSSITMQNLFDNVMSTFPNNNDQTIFTTVMSPQINYWTMTTRQ